MDDPATPVFAEEQVLVSGAVLKRRREFSTTRHCARRALSAIGIPPRPILKGPHGEPLWPDGTVGSMTHCEGYRAAAVAPAAEVVSLGIDAEPHKPLPDGLLPLVADEHERDHLAELTRTVPDLAWDRLLFSAKESAYKAWHPAVRGWLDFEDARVELDPRGGRFRVTMLARDAGPVSVGATLGGRWAVSGALLVTAIAAVRQPAQQG